jgi:hypothetical protein
MPAATNSRPSLVARGVAYALAGVPAALLGLAAARTGAVPLAAAALGAGVGAFFLGRKPPVWRPQVAGPLGLIGLCAALLIWVHNPQAADAGVRAARGGLLLYSAIILAVYDLNRTGAGPRRRAARLCRKLIGEPYWPQSAVEIASLPNVRRLREASATDPGPALALLQDPREEVRIAGFAALAAPRLWRVKELGVMLDAARRAETPELKIAAASAVGTAADGQSVAVLAIFLRDRVPEVRWAAGAAAVDSAGRKWVAVRDAIRSALADPKLVSDGPLPGSVGRLSPVAVCDLTSWAGEAEPLGGRAVRTLVEHYGHELQTFPDYDLTVELSRQITDSTTPTALRVELGLLFRNLGLLTTDLLDRMTNAGQPGPIRLLAAEALLLRNPTDPDGLDALRGLARTPNREMALSIARVLQSVLRIDVGLPLQVPLPAKSKQAGEVARRVLAWATGATAAPAEEPYHPAVKPRTSGTSDIASPGPRPKVW